MAKSPSKIIVEEKRNSDAKKQKREGIKRV